MGATTTVKLKGAPKAVRTRSLTSLQEMDTRELGFMQGYSEGLAKAQVDSQVQLEAKIKASRAHWDAVAKSLNQFPRGVAQKYREQMIELAFGAVRKILAATPVTREEVKAQIEQMLQSAEAASEIEVQLNPQDLEMLTNEDRTALMNDDISHLKWTANTAVPRGGCILRGEFGWMDGRRENRLNKLEQLAKESVQNVQPPSA